NGQNPVRGLHRAVAQRDGRAVHPLDAKHFQPPDDADDVQNRIDGADFMEMYLLRWHAVDLALRGRDRGERAICELAHPFRRSASLYELSNLPDVASVRLRRNLEINLLANDLPANDLPDLDADVLQPEHPR